MKLRNSQKEANETNSKEVENLYRPIIRKQFLINNFKAFH